MYCVPSIPGMPFVVLVNVFFSRKTLILYGESLYTVLTFLKPKKRVTEIDIGDDMKGNAVNKQQESTFFVERFLLIKNNHINIHQIEKYLGFFYKI
jgi:hypothetical protein